MSLRGGTRTHCIMRIGWILVGSVRRAVMPMGMSIKKRTKEGMSIMRGRRIMVMRIVRGWRMCKGRKDTWRSCSKKVTWTLGFIRKRPKRIFWHCKGCYSKKHSRYSNWAGRYLVWKRWACNLALEMFLTWSRIISHRWCKFKRSNSR